MTKELDEAIHDAVSALDYALPLVAHDPMLEAARAALLEAYDLQKAEERKGEPTDAQLYALYDLRGTHGPVSVDDLRNVWLAGAGRPAAP